MRMWPEILWIGDGKELHGKLHGLVVMHPDGSSIAFDCIDDDEHNFYTVRLVRDAASGRLVGPLKRGQPGEVCGQVTAMRYESKDAILLRGDWDEDDTNYLWVMDVRKA